MALTHHTGIPRPLNAGCSPRVIISVSNNPFCLGSSVTFTPTITCLETAKIASYAWIVNGNIVSTSGDPYVTTELTNNDSVYLLVIGTNGISYFSNVIYMVVTSDGCPENISYGLLYNWYAATDVRKITSSDDWVVPLNADWNTLKTYLGDISVVGGKLKETGFVYWLSPNTGASNLVSFNARGAGTRLVSSGGVFLQLQESTFYWTKSSISTNGYQSGSISAYSEGMSSNVEAKASGLSLRLMRTATAPEQLLADGTPCDNYVGNDGKIYRTVKIGTQVWVSCNIAETKFRNGDYLHGYEGGSYQAISNANWASANSAMCCCYGDDINNI